MPIDEKPSEMIPPHKREYNWYTLAGTALIAVSAFLFLLIFFPVIREELRYMLAQGSRLAPPKVESASEVAATGASERVLVPVDVEFGIVIPKIGANAKVVPDVDWEDSRVYQRALTQGVAHAAGTGKPGETGNVFIFAHSGANFYEASRYNAVFYLLNKLEPGDEIDIFYKKEKHTYTVKRRSTVPATEVRFLAQEGREGTLTLMTCWPAGTTLSRLIVEATEVIRS